MKARSPDIAVRLLAVAALFAVTAGLAGCDNDDKLLRAKRVERKTELIGGPAAKGKVGDFLLENDKVRAIIAGYGATWAAGIFGGTLLDVDLRRSQAEYAYGMGQDSFAETFPTMNLIVVDPEAELRRILPNEDGELEVVLTEPKIFVEKDGSDGQEAIVRVQGAGGAMFEMLKILDKPFLRSFVGEPIDVSGVEMLANLGITELSIPGVGAAIPDLLPIIWNILMPAGTPIPPALANLELHVFRLLNRIQFDFDFQTDYIVRPGDSYITIRTTVWIAPPNATRMNADCPQVECDLDCGDAGYVLKEVLSDCADPEKCTFAFGPSTWSTQDSTFCPVCECADHAPMPVLTEQRSVFNDIIGNDPALWADPSWKSGVLAGDFLFFGSQVSIFSPGLGLDEDRKIFEDLWLGVGTIGNPLTLDWIAAVGDGTPVSYAMVTRNEDRRTGADWAECPSYRYALAWADPARESTVVRRLADDLGFAEGTAASGVRGLIVDRTPMPLESFATDEFPAATSAEELGELALGSTRGQELAALFGDAAELTVLPAGECQQSRVLVPIFTSSATAVMTHESTAGLDVSDEAGEQVVLDRARTFTYERYLVVGEGDVGSLLDTVLDLREEPYGHVAGFVVEDPGMRPVHHARVFAVRDPRPVIETLSEVRRDRLPYLPNDIGKWSYDLLRAVNLEVFGDTGIVSHMQTDVGDDPVHDGNFRGALPPGDYLLVAKAGDNPPSTPAPIQVQSGKTAKATLALLAPATIDYRVVDATGALTPAKLVLVALDEETGEPMPWYGTNRPELGDSLWDFGVHEIVLAGDGAGSVVVEPGLYRIYASRGFEYTVDIRDQVRLRPGQTYAMDWNIARVVDTEGWISGDFHLHQAPSVDSSLALGDRVLSNVVEGLEFVTSTDHDATTDYRPMLNLLGLYNRLAFQAGVEVSPLEFGHYNVYPVGYDDRQKEVHDPPPWQFRRTGEVWDEMRARGLDGPDQTIVQVNHPSDGFQGLFSQIGIDGLSLERSTPGMEMCNPATVEIPCNFDAVELMNERRFELLRTPTVWEVEMYNRCYQEITSTHDQSRFSVLGAPGDASTVDAEQSVCGNLQALPAGCASLPDAPPADDDARGAYIELRDHCAWHRELRAEFARCNQGLNLIECKRATLEALKMVFVRYMMERTPAEQEALAFARAHPEWKPECDYALASAGCEERRDEEGNLIADCAEDGACACHACVCGTDEAPGIMPECCRAPDDAENPGTGWTAACAAACKDDCHSCGAEPCMDRFQTIDYWMTFLNQGFVITGMANSDSHKLRFEGGMPRNYLRSGTDDPAWVDYRDVNDAIRAHEVVMSSGPFAEFSIGDAKIGGTTHVPEGETVDAQIKIQTPEWFGVDRVEIYRNGHLEKMIYPESDKAAIIDLDTTVSLPRPAVDSWYVVMAYGMNAGQSMEPVYNGRPYGSMLIPSVIALGTTAILAPFSDLLDAFSSFIDVNSLLGSIEMPDSFPAFPVVITNPIWVDLEGDGFDPPDAPDRDGDGKADLPAFCSQPCALVRDADGMVVEAQSTCGVEQLCIDDGSGNGRCVIPLPEECRDAGWGNDLTQVAAPLTTDDADERDRGLDSRERLTRKIDRQIRRELERSKGFGAKKIPMLDRLRNTAP